MLMPTILTVITKHTASFKEFQTKSGIVPAKKNFITAKGSISPAALRVLKIEVKVFKHGITIKPKNKYAKRTKPKIFTARPASKVLLSIFSLLPVQKNFKANTT